MMNYELNDQGILKSAVTIIIIGLVLILLFLSLRINGSKLFVLFALIVVMFFVIAGPQLLLLYQYKKATKYTSLKIDYEKGSFFFIDNDIIKEQKFEDMKSLTLVKAVVPKLFFSPMLMFMLTEHFYYYKAEFNSESFYITSLLYPEPKLRGEKDFYNWYIERETCYANIKD